MADEQQPKEPASGSTPPEPPAVAAPPAATAPPAPTEADAPPNKLHEWGAAALIMLLLAGILYAFLSFIRGASM